MAAPLDPHWEAIPLETRQLLEKAGGASFSQNFYLAGGTALALRLGHRISRDLDFFSETDELTNDLRARILAYWLGEFPALQVVTDAPGDLTIHAHDRDVGFYSYGYKLLEPGDKVENVRVAGLLDIAAMKLDAIAGRGARRDFYDLYYLAQQFPLEHILEQAQIKYPYARDYAMTVMPYLNDFTNADRDTPVHALTPITWAQIKSFFLTEAQRLAKRWFL